MGRGRGRCLSALGRRGGGGRRLGWGVWGSGGLGREEGCGAYLDCVRGKLVNMRAGGANLGMGNMVR